MELEDELRLYKRRESAHKLMLDAIAQMNRRQVKRLIDCGEGTVTEYAPFLREE